MNTTMAVLPASGHRAADDRFQRLDFTAHDPFLFPDPANVGPYTAFLTGDLRHNQQFDEFLARHTPGEQALLQFARHSHIAVSGTNCPADHLRRPT